MHSNKSQTLSIKTLILSSVLILSACTPAPSPEKPEEERFLDARVEQFCFVQTQDYEGKTEEEMNQMDAEGLAIMGNHGFEVGTMQEFVQLSQRMQIAMAKSGFHEEFSQKFIEKIEEKNCASEEELAKLKGEA